MGVPETRDFKFCDGFPLYGGLPLTIEFVADVQYAAGGEHSSPPRRPRIEGEAPEDVIPPIVYRGGDRENYPGGEGPPLWEINRG